MEVINTTDNVISTILHTNGCCKDGISLANASRFDVHTGNISHWSSLKRRSTQNPAAELKESLVKALSISTAKGKCKEDAYKGKVRVVCKNEDDIEEVTEAERPLMKVTVKVFAHQTDHSQVREAVLQSLNELNISHFDVVFLTFPVQEEDSKISFTEMAKPFWKEMEKLYDEGIASHLAVCDLDAEKLRALLSWARIKPKVNQVNLASCCHMPQDLVGFAKEEDILLHTHGDPPTLLPSTILENVISSVAENDKMGWNTRWAVRYSVVVKCRGVIKNKGYIMSCDRQAEDINDMGNGHDVDH